MTSYYHDTFLRRAREQRLLMDVSLELTYACNLDCFYCYNDRDKPGKPLTLAQYRALLDDLAQMQTLFLMLTGGEPMVHPHFFDIASHAKQLGFVIRLRTNGHSLNARNALRLSREVDPYQVEVSLHGATAEVHDRQTRVQGSFDRLVNNIELCRGQGLNIGAVCTPTAWNEYQLEDMFELADRLGIPLRFQGPVSPRDNGDTSPMAIQPQPGTWGRLQQIQRRRQAQAGDPVASGDVLASSGNCELTVTCGVGALGADVDPYGNVLACMHLQEPAGNLHEASMPDIWRRSPVFERARRRSAMAAENINREVTVRNGAPLHCIAVEENAAKGCGSCSGGCG